MQISGALKSPLEIIRALAMVGYPREDVAAAAAEVFPWLDAIGLARCLVDDQAFPGTNAAQLGAALTPITRYAASEVEDAISAVFSSNPTPDPAPVPAERFTAIAVSMQGGNRGIEFWSAASNGQIWTLYQQSPGADWSVWEGPGFKQQPVALRQLAAALQNNGNVLLVGLDDNGNGWTCGQTAPGGDWGAWGSLSLAPQPAPFRRVAASQQGGGRGIKLWTTGEDGQIWTLEQSSPGGNWTSWEGPGFRDQPVPMFKMAAAQQNNENIMFWGLDAEGRLWGIAQNAPGGGWDNWSGPNFSGQPEPFVEIAASEQGGSRGVEIWGVTAAGQIWTLYQTSAGGAWSSWEGPGFKGQAVPTRRVAAALQNTGNVMLWAVGPADDLWIISQLWPGGDWGPWSPAPDLPVGCLPPP
jgi:hypothetical protein